MGLLILHSIHPSNLQLMKNSIFLTIFLAVLFLIGIPRQAEAQLTGEQIKKLEALAQQFNLEYQRQQQLVAEYARQHNIPIRRQIGDQIIVLSRIENGEPVFTKDDNVNAQQSISADEVKTGGTLGLTLTGAGQTLGIWEAGGAVRTTHQEFGGRATQIDAPAATTNHATHVTGTMIASGVDANAQGFSSAANLNCFDANNDNAEMAAASIAATPIRVSNHSYGTIVGWDFANANWSWNNNQWRFGAYDNQAQAWDNIANASPFYLIVKSAGNDRNDAGASGANHLHPPDLVTVFTDNHPVDGNGGYDCLPDYSTAKNILTIGATNDVAGGYAGAGGVTMTAFSSWGPTDDGRIKPDVSANGANLYSSGNASDTSYSTLSGTSMSSPSVSGSIGLLLEHWGNLYGAGSVPRATTMKGVLIHTADETGAAQGPDYQFGWGLVNVSDAAQLMSTNAFDGCEQLFTGTVNGAGGTWTYTFESSGMVPVKATLVWSDPAPAAVNAGVTNPGVSYLVNNLDLQITEGANTFLPWVLNPANPANAATTGVNNTDNVEQVLVGGPAAGTYTITVTFTNGVMADAQDFAVILSGNDAAVENNTISFITITDKRTYTARKTLTFGPAVTINAPGDVDAVAGSSVRLVPGFKVTAGGKFRARIQTGGICAGATGSLATWPVTSGATDPSSNLGFRDSNGSDKNTNSVGELDFRIFPNPVDQQVQIRLKLSTPSTIHLRILDQLGRLVYQAHQTEEYAEGEHAFEYGTQGLAPGVYYVSVETSEGRKVEKLVVQHD